MGLELKNNQILTLLRDQKIRAESNRRHRRQLLSVPLPVALVPLKLATYFAILYHVITLVLQAAPLNLT